MRRHASPTPKPTGFTLLELAVALTLTLAGLALIVPWALADKYGLARAARLAESQLVRARLHAIAAHAATTVSANGPALDLRDRAGGLLARVELSGPGLRTLDSVRVRPGTIRFNERGQGSAGSVYLYRGRRGIRVLSNFLGRTRRSRFHF